ncbi:MAG: hypothetical protein K8U57_24775 [Planctomycetes bacterium]|nr:hypothetical protein [Planctomycetota bacterium]
MKKKDVFKKHHFWILLGIVPLFVMLAAIMISSNVGAAVDKKLDEYKKATDSLNGKTNPKQDELIKKIQEQSSKVQVKREELHRLNWERQKDMYVWPKDVNGHLKDIERKNLKFGDTIPFANSQYDEFKKPEVYLAEFSTVYPNKKGSVPTTGMADTLAPTQFKGGWQSVLRHVNAFDDRALTSEQIWLMMEDIWIQRSLLEAVRTVNAQMAEFHRVKYEKNGVVIDDPDKKTAEDPLRRKFHSRIWDIELEVNTKDNKRVLGGRLINHTDRLQLMGLNNTMILKVWLQNGKDLPPFEFKIGGEFVPGRGALKSDGKTPANVLDIVPTDDHAIPVSFTVAEIAKVEQVFDTRTVPVRRIEAMGLGFRDARSATKQLFMPEFTAFKPKADVVPKDDAKAPGGPPIGPIGPPFGTGPGGVGPATGASGGGTVDTVVNANKKRYLQITQEVRRMPVAIALIVDQAYMQDVLLAFANSKLKLQITQVDWARFRPDPSDRLGGTGSTGDPSNPEQPQSIIVGGVPGSGGGLGSEFGKPLGPPVGPRPIGPIGPTGPGGFPGGTSTATVSESQLTSGLIQLQVYGVASLYEKYVPPGETPKETPKETAVEPKKTDPKPKDTKADPKATDPKKDPAVTDAKTGKEPPVPDPKTPKEKEPAVPDPKTPKMRRRRQ